MYRSIDCQFWSDRTIRELSPPEKLLFLYLITNPHSHYSGLYYLPLVTMQHEVGLGRGFEGGMKGVQDHQLAIFNHEFEQILVLNMFAYQGKGKNMEKGAATHLQTLHNSPLVVKFLERYPSVSQYWKGDPLRTPFEPPYLPLTTSDSPDPDPVLLSSCSIANYTVEDLHGKWNAITGVKPCKMIEGALRDRIKRLLREHDAAWWDNLFVELSKSKFLTGQISTPNGRSPFKIDLDWATGPINLGKILSGKYADDVAAIRSRGVM